MRGGGRRKKSRMIPRFLAAVSVEVMFTQMGNSEGGANLELGKIESSFSSSHVN